MKKRFIYRPQALLGGILALLLCFGGVQALAEESGLVLGGNLHLRKGPSEDTEILATYHAGTVVTLTGEQVDGFYPVRLSNGDEGYMEADFIAVENVGRVSNGDKYVNLHKEPGPDAEIVGEFTTGTHLTIIDFNQDWCYIEIEGLHGYMATDMIVAAEPQQNLNEVVVDSNSIVDTAGAGNAFSLNIGETPARQVGESNTQAGSEGNFSYTIEYPYLDNQVADNAIAGWISLGMQAGRDVLKDAPADATATLNGQYEAFLTGDRYSGVLMVQRLDSSALAHPQEFIYTLNLNRDTGELLVPTDLFTRNAGVVHLLAQKLSTLVSDGTVVDDGWLENLLVTPDGIEVILPEGEFLSTSAGTVRILLTYSELAAQGLLALPLATAN